LTGGRIRQKLPQGRKLIAWKLLTQELNVPEINSSHRMSFRKPVRIYTQVYQRLVSLNIPRITQHFHQYGPRRILDGAALDSEKHASKCRNSNARLPNGSEHFCTPITARGDPLPLAFHGDGRSTPCEILPHGDKRQLSGVAFDKSEDHAGGFYRLKAAPSAARKRGSRIRAWSRQSRTTGEKRQHGC
jgi:hypothetical protein